MKKSGENWSGPGIIWKRLLSRHSCLKKLYLLILPASGRRFARKDDDGPDQDADGGLLDFCCGALRGKNVQHSTSSGTDCTNKMKRFTRN